MRHQNTMECYSALDILPFFTTWMKLKDSLLNDILLNEKDILLNEKNQALFFNWSLLNLNPLVSYQEIYCYVLNGHKIQQKTFLFPLKISGPLSIMIFSTSILYNESRAETHRINSQPFSLVMSESFLKIQMLKIYRS